LMAHFSLDLKLFSSVLREWSTVNELTGLQPWDSGPVCA
jgi:hypothetical protein